MWCWHAVCLSWESSGIAGCCEMLLPSCSTAAPLSWPHLSRKQHDVLCAAARLQRNAESGSILCLCHAWRQRPLQAKRAACSQEPAVQNAAATSPTECRAPLPAAGKQPAGTQKSTSLPHSLALPPWPKKCQHAGMPGECKHSSCLPLENMALTEQASAAAGEERRL